MPHAIVERDGHLMTITMNRPQRMNALSGEMLIRMFDAYEAASRDPEVRCILVTGAGGNFCSGADLRAMAGDAADADREIDVQARMKADPDIHWKALFRGYRPTKPIVAAVEGLSGVVPVRHDAHSLRISDSSAGRRSRSARRALWSRKPTLPAVSPVTAPISA